MTAESYLVNIDPQRATSLSYAWPQPYAMVEHAKLRGIADDTLTLSDGTETTMAKKVINYLVENGFVTPRFFTYKAYKDGYASGRNYVAFITYTNLYPSPGKLKLVQDEVQKFISLVRQKAPVPEIWIDLVNVERNVVLHRSNIGVLDMDLHWAVAAWERCKIDFAERLEKDLETQWYFCGLFKVGLTDEDENPWPAVVVFVRPLTIANWGELEGWVRKRVKRVTAKRIELEIEPEVERIDSYDCDNGVYPEIYRMGMI
ncbi:hypothetical protein N7520_000751 [Penicillium odoratum]|uniref:uncharacterized protein n=1 Tax=Penicillium odoratum TaxID=1167516 RepID=UPI0025468841|nr:uncharacterized protein N7520_000751 [Penicillium odoratum]KAJ5777505.1 hypothetical protein N7520_000751 [Penicillium odoratum]